MTPTNPPVANTNNARYITEKIVSPASTILQKANLELTGENLTLIQKLVEQVWTTGEEQTETIETLIRSGKTEQGQLWLIDQHLQHPDKYIELTEELAYYLYSDQTPQIVEHILLAITSDNSENNLKRNLTEYPELLQTLFEKYGSINSKTTRQILATIPKTKQMLPILTAISYNTELQKFPDLAITLAAQTAPWSNHTCARLLADAGTHINFQTGPITPDMIHNLLDDDLDDYEHTSLLATLLQTPNLDEQVETKTLHQTAQLFTNIARHNTYIAVELQAETVGNLLKGTPATWQNLFKRLQMWEQHNIEKTKLPVEWLKNYVKHLPEPTTAQKLTYQKLAAEHGWAETNIFNKQKPDRIPASKLPIKTPKININPKNSR